MANGLHLGWSYCQNCLVCLNDIIIFGEINLSTTEQSEESFWFLGGLPDAQADADRRGFTAWLTLQVANVKHDLVQEIMSLLNFGHQ